MNFFKRLFKIGQAEANSALDKMEDPILMIEQGIKDMRGDLSKNVEAMAQVKALAIRSKNDLEGHESAAAEYYEKAMLLLKKGQSEDLDSAEAEMLAKEALNKREERLIRVEATKADSVKFDDSVKQLESNISELKNNISEWENKLSTLKARAKVSKATTNLNKQLAEIDGGETVAMLERMKEKVNHEEALSEAYADMAKNKDNVDQKIDKAIDKTSASVEDSLADLKNKLGINPKSGE
jgi:phage shock protein A